MNKNRTDLILFLNCRTTVLVEGMYIDRLGIPLNVSLRGERTYFSSDGEEVFNFPFSVIHG